MQSFRKGCSLMNEENALIAFVGQYILTHTPVPSWFSTQYANGVYLMVHQNVASLIDWYNIQFYNWHFRVHNVFWPPYSIISNAAKYCTVPDCSSRDTMECVQYHMFLLAGVSHIFQMLASWCASFLTLIRPGLQRCARLHSHNKKSL